MKKKAMFIAVILSVAMLGACGGNGNAAASQSAAAEASRLAEEEAKKAEEEAAEAARLAEEEAAKKAEEEATAALEAELKEYGIESADEGILVEIAAACAEDDYYAACDLMRGDAYEEEARALEASEEDRRIVQTPSGRIGIYHANGSASSFAGDYFIYFGDYAGDQREGDGVWLEIDSWEGYEDYYFISKGEWHDDLPNGKFENRTRSGDGGEARRIITVKDGVQDGEETNYWTDDSGEEKEFTQNYRDGYCEFFVIDGHGYTMEDVNSFEYDLWDMDGEVGWYYQFVDPDGSIFYMKEEDVFADMDEEYINSLSRRSYLLGFRPWE